MTSVTPSGGSATTFAYDANGIRTKTVQPGGITTYFPFPGYEETVNGANTIKRSMYALAGQTIAMRVTGDPVSGNNGISYFYNDHLGSNTALRKPDGSWVATYYLPLRLRSVQAFGNYRGAAPNQTITDRDFTGQPQNRAVGLLYYQARFYVPSIGRFASADTLVPDPANPQSWNRYSYVNNQPLVYNDPTGHCPAPTGDWVGQSVICFALFIEPASIAAGPFLLHGDGRSFDSNSDPGASRGYVWINTETGKTNAIMNPSGYYFQGNLLSPGLDSLIYFDPSAQNLWDVTRSESGEIHVSYDLVVSGPLDWLNAAPHINGNIIFRPNGQGGFEFTFTRDGFPWAEAYYHDGQGGIKTIFQDTAVRGNPHDLFAIEPGINFPRTTIQSIENLRNGPPQISSKPYHRGGGGSGSFNQPLQY